MNQINYPYQQNINGTLNQEFQNDYPKTNQYKQTLNDPNYNPIREHLKRRVQPLVVGQGNVVPLTVGESPWQKYIDDLTEEEKQELAKYPMIMY